MNKTYKGKRSIVIVIVIFASLILAPLVQAAPEAPPHIALFETAGLPAGVPLTISGVRTNPGEQEGPYSITFSSPGPSPNVTIEPGTQFTYMGFPAWLNLSGQDYFLNEIAPVSPQYAGFSGDTTYILATYSPTCSGPLISVHPASQTVDVGVTVTFTVTADGFPPLSY